MCFFLQKSIVLSSIVEYSSKYMEIYCSIKLETQVLHLHKKSGLEFFIVFINRYGVHSL